MVLLHNIIRRSDLPRAFENFLRVRIVDHESQHTYTAMAATRLQGACRGAAGPRE